MVVKILDDRGIGIDGRRSPRASATRPPTARGSSTSASRRRPTTRACASRSRPRGRGRADRLLGRQHRHRHRPAAAVPGLDPGTEPDRRRRHRARRRRWRCRSSPTTARSRVPVAAPGVDVVSTSRDGGYETNSGTSMAAPHVAGVAALMASADPRLSAAELRALLLEHAVRPPEAGPAEPGRRARRRSQAAMRTPRGPARPRPAARPRHRLASRRAAGRACARQYTRRGRRGPLRAPEASTAPTVASARPARLRAPGSLLRPAKAGRRLVLRGRSARDGGASPGGRGRLRRRRAVASPRARSRLAGSTRRRRGARRSCSTAARRRRRI